MAGRCTHCGRRDAGRESGVPEELAARLAARQQDLTAAGRGRTRRGRQLVVRSWRAAPAMRRWLPWLAPAALLALAASYAFASGVFEYALVPASASTVTASTGAATSVPELAPTYGDDD